MVEKTDQTENRGEMKSFFRQPGVERSTIPVGEGVPLGLMSSFNAELGIGGVYGAWGESYDNNTLPELIQRRLGMSLDTDDRMNLAELGFLHRHHSPELSDEDHLELELEVGARLLRHAAQSNGWKTSDVQGVLIGISFPIVDDYIDRIADRAGIPTNALKCSVHKACDGSMGALHAALNPKLAKSGQRNIAQELHGKKVLVGGIEGLSRFTGLAQDKNAAQLFGNGGAMIGITPGENMRFLVGKSHESFDEEGTLKVRMYYPHSRSWIPGDSMVEVSEEGPSHVRLAGFMHEPENEAPVAMDALMGMVKLFVRTGVNVVADVVQEYQSLMNKLNMPDKSIAVGIVHHANLKINKLKVKRLRKKGIQFPMPWLLSEFGNVSSASNLIAFLRQLKHIRSGDHVLFDGFGAGTYYDVFAVSVGT